MPKLNSIHNMPWDERAQTLRQLFKDDPKQVLFYWMVERERIRLNKVGGEPWPWTVDPVLQQYKFCNVFRKEDVTTKYYIEWVKDLDSRSIFINTVLFRFINRVSTIQYLLKHYGKLEVPDYISDMDTICAVLNELSKTQSVFGNAYMINSRGTPSGTSKIDAVVRHIVRAAVLKANEITAFIIGSDTVQMAVEKMVTLPNVGKYMAYEIASDLTHTPLLNDVTDIDTWTNVHSPRAMRGLSKALGLPFASYFYGEYETLRKCGALLKEAKALWPWADTKGWLHMREIERCLCEFDNYTKVLIEGKGLKRPYTYKQVEREVR